MATDRDRLKAEADALNASDPTTLRGKTREDLVRSALNLIGNIGGAGFGMFQRRQGLRDMNRQMPTFEMTQEDPLLQDEIAKAQVAAELGSPQYMRAVDEAAAQQLTGSRAASNVAGQGQSNITGSIMQEGAINSARTRRGGALENENIRLQRQGVLQGLLGQRQNERAMQSNERTGVYNAQLQNYLFGQQNAANVANAGTQNIVDSLYNLLGNSADAFSIARKLKGLRGNAPLAASASETVTPTGAIDVKENIELMPNREEFIRNPLGYGRPQYIPYREDSILRAR